MIKTPNNMLLKLVRLIKMILKSSRLTDGTEKKANGCGNEEGMRQGDGLPLTLFSVTLDGNNKKMWG